MAISGVDFSGVAVDTATGVTAAVDDILAMGISPADKEARIAKIIRSVGNAFHDQLYGASAAVFDSSAMSSVGLDDAEGQAQRLANKIVRNYALTRDTAEALVAEYYNSVLASAQSEAFSNAISMQKHPTLTRTVVNETCKWCSSKAGTHTNPTAEDFKRHRICDCLFEVSGYNSRNGMLKNYVKRSK